MNMNITYRLFDIAKENKNQLFELYKAVYGDASLYIERWKWEIEQNPNIEDIKILIAEYKNSIVGATTRLPFKIKINDRILNSAFSVNSMVHPDFRRKGIIQELYNMSFEIYPLLYSKGTVLGMYKLLMKMGYQAVEPNTFMVSIISFLRWPLWRLGIYKPSVNIDDIYIDNDKGFYNIEEFRDEFDDLWGRVSSLYSNIVVKNSAYMNWRYLNIPHKQYRMFYRQDNNNIVSMAVISQSGTTAKIVDILWDKTIKDEPFYTIKYIKEICKKCGFLKILCWTPMSQLREALKKNLFVDKGETCTFSFYTRNESIEYFSNGADFHFVEGDGDSEYLTL